MPTTGNAGGGIESDRPHTGSTVGNTYLLKGTEDSNRTAAQASPSFKEQVC